MKLATSKKNIFFLVKFSDRNIQIWWLRIVGDDLALVAAGNFFEDDESTADSLVDRLASNLDLGFVWITQAPIACLLVFSTALEYRVIAMHKNSIVVANVRSLVRGSLKRAGFVAVCGVHDQVENDRCRQRVFLVAQDPGRPTAYCGLLLTLKF